MRAFKGRGRMGQPSCLQHTIARPTNDKASLTCASTAVDDSRINAFQSAKDASNGCAFLARFSLSARGGGQFGGTPRNCQPPGSWNRTHHLPGVRGHPICLTIVHTELTLATIPAGKLLIRYFPEVAPCFAEIGRGRSEKAPAAAKRNP